MSEQFTLTLRIERATDHQILHNLSSGKIVTWAWARPTQQSYRQGL
ncbi:MAG: hypothetical protein VX588_07580 [Verrucomicrobiota bacterium]|nr:hypothetical protein [Verrucomicrobiota bacterium]